MCWASTLIPTGTKAPEQPTNLKIPSPRLLKVLLVFVYIYCDDALFSVMYLCRKKVQWYECVGLVANPTTATHHNTPGNINERTQLAHWYSMRVKPKCDTTFDELMYVKPNPFYCNLIYRPVGNPITCRNEFTYRL